MLYKSSFDEIETGEEEPLVIHRHGEKAGEALIVFIHGLGGKRYRTWTPKPHDPAKVSFPRFLYEDFDQLDVGLYAYRSLLGRLAFWKSIPLDREADVLSSRLAQLAQAEEGEGYRSIILVGHSMGGILSRAAVAQLIRKSDTNTLAAVKGLFLMASPQAGSLRVPQALAWLTADSRALRAHSDLVADTYRTLLDHVVAKPSHIESGKYYIPSYVVAGAEDNWVDRFSSGLGVVAENLNTVRGSHFETVKPAHKQNDTYIWVKGKLRRLLAGLRPPPDLFEDFDLAGKLMIDRAALRKNVRDVIHPDGRARIVAVKGKKRCGKSHSIYFLDHVEQLGGFEKLVVALEECGSPATFGPVDLAASLLRLLQGDAARIPNKGPGQTDSRWIQSIAQVVLGYVKAKGRIILIVLDGFAHPSLPPLTRELIRELIRTSDRERGLRVMLLDCRDDLLIAEAGARLVIENVADIGDEDLRRFFLAQARAGGRPDPSVEVLDGMIATVRAEAERGRGDAPSDQSDNERIGQAAEAVAQEMDR